MQGQRLKDEVNQPHVVDKINQSRNEKQGKIRSWTPNLVIVVFLTMIVETPRAAGLVNAPHSSASVVVAATFEDFGMVFIVTSLTDVL